MPSNNEVTYMSHNHQLHVYGRCNCVCHQGKTICNCGWRLRFGLPIESRIKIRSTNLKSRVVAFGGRRKSSVSTTNGIFGAGKSELRPIDFRKKRNEKI